MRKVLVAGWFIVLLAMWCFDWRFGPLLRTHEIAGVHGAAVDRLMLAQDYAGAAGEYGKMLGALPDDAAHRTVRLQLELAMDTAGAKTGRQLESIKSLDDTLERFDGDPAIAPGALKDVRRELGMLHYYDAWLMRLQNAQASLWTAEAERARQQFRYLATADENASIATSDALNVERVIRFEQLDLSVLRARKLPKQATGLDRQPADQSEGDLKIQTTPKSSGRSGQSPPGPIGRPGGPGGVFVHTLRGS